MYSYAHIIPFDPFTQVPCETLAIYNKNKSFKTIAPWKLNFTHSLYPKAKVDATQVSWRIECNKVHDVWLPPNQTKNSDGTFFGDLHDKFGDCQYNGLTGAFKAYHGGQLSNRNGEKMFLPNDTERPANYLSICMNFKDEAPYLKEWLEYHLSIGVDHFYLYNNESSDNYLEILKPYQDKGIITLNNVSGKTAKKKSFEHFVKNYKFLTYWVALIDSDEYLTFTEEDMTGWEFFKNYEDHSGVGLNWLMFGSSGLSGVQTPVLEKFTKCAPPYDAAHMLGDQSKIDNVCRHIKSIVNPRKISGSWNNPHYCNYETKYCKKSQNFAVDTHKNPITESGGSRRGLAATSKENTKHDKAFIRHYFTKTKEEWIRRKMRYRDDAPLEWYTKEEDAIDRFNTVEKSYNSVDYRDLIKELRKLKNK